MHAVDILSAFLPANGDEHGGHDRRLGKRPQTYLSRISDVFAPYLLRIKVPKSEEGTKEIRSKYGAGGSEKGNETCIYKKKRSVGILERISGYLDNVYDT